MTKFIQKIFQNFTSISCDKILHFNVCMFLAFFSSKVASVVFNNYIGALIGFIIAIIIGVLKEIYDSQGHGTPEWADIKADAIGAATGSIMSLI